MKRRGIIGIGLAACLLLALVSPALAGGLTVSGAKIETTVSPGKDYTYSMKVENTSDESMDIAVEVKGYGMSTDRDVVVLDPEEDKSPYAARELLAVSPTNFHLEPGDSQTIKVTAKIASGIGDGGRYAIIFIHTAPKGGAIATITAVGARVLLTISGSKLDTNSEITQVSLGKTASQEPAGVMVTLANKGNYHYKPQIQARLRNGDRVVATTSLAPGWPMIPGYSRQFRLDFVGAEILSTADKVDIEVKDESGNLVTGGSYPLGFIKKQEVLPPEKSPVPPLPRETPQPTASEKISLPPQASTTASLPPETAPAPPASVISWPMLGGIIVVVIVGLLVFFLVKRRADY